MIIICSEVNRGTESEVLLSKNSIGCCSAFIIRGICSTYLLSSLSSQERYLWVVNLEVSNLFSSGNHSDDCEESFQCGDEEDTKNSCEQGLTETRLDAAAGEILFRELINQLWQ